MASDERSQTLHKLLFTKNDPFTWGCGHLEERHNIVSTSPKTINIKEYLCIIEDPEWSPMSSLSRSQTSMSGNDTSVVTK